jgi:hypothetical protein
MCKCPLGTLRTLFAPSGTPGVFLKQNQQGELSCSFLHVGVSKYLLPVITIWDDFQGHLVRPGSTLWMFSMAVRAPAFCLGRLQSDRVLTRLTGGQAPLISAELWK